VTAARIVKAVDIFRCPAIVFLETMRGEDRHLSLPACVPCVPPDQFGLDSFEERFNGSIIIAIPFTTHRRFEPVLTQDFLIIVRTVLAATVRVVPSRQIALQSSAG
jgi:hypothetical protein